MKEADQFGLSLFSPYAGIDDIRWFTKQFGDLDSYVALNQKLYDEVLKYNAYDATMEFDARYALYPAHKTGFVRWINRRRIWMHWMLRRRRCIEWMGAGMMCIVQVRKNLVRM
jgi:hypothetical protein